MMWARSGASPILASAGGVLSVKLWVSTCVFVGVVVSSFLLVSTWYW